jgi:ornithine--oxo-acid transaminase
MGVSASMPGPTVAEAQQLSCTNLADRRSTQDVAEREGSASHREAVAVVGDHERESSDQIQEDHMTVIATSVAQHLSLVDRFAAHSYLPLPVVITQGSGAWVTDVDGHHYLDCLAGYSALNFGHGHPDLLAAAHEQLARVTLTSRAFHDDRLGPFCAGLADLAGMDAVLPMNTGAEAVETAIKIARRWGNRVQGVEDGNQRVVVAAGNFHGRTTTIVGFSSDFEARDGFGPFTPGFDVVPYGDSAALGAAI